MIYFESEIEFDSNIKTSKNAHSNLLAATYIYKQKPQLVSWGGGAILESKFSYFNIYINCFILFINQAFVYRIRFIIMNFYFRRFYDETLR